MPTNALLVRWNGGWIEVENNTSITAHSRHEAFLSLGALQSTDEATTVATRQLETFADPRTEIVADIEPAADADRPYLAYRVGDTLTVPDIDGVATAERVRAITVNLDEDGEVTYALELKDRILELREREAQTLKKMANGDMRGQAAVATPLSRSWQAPPSCCAPAALGTYTLILYSGSRLNNLYAELGLATSTPSGNTVGGTAIIYGEGRWLSIPTRADALCRLYTSASGVAGTWTDVEDLTAPNLFTAPAFARHMNGIFFVASTEQFGTPHISTDGLTWSEQQLTVPSVLPMYVFGNFATDGTNVYGYNYEGTHVYVNGIDPFDANDWVKVNLADSNRPVRWIEYDTAHNKFISMGGRSDAAGTWSDLVVKTGVPGSTTTVLPGLPSGGGQKWHAAAMCINPAGVCLAIVQDAAFVDTDPVTPDWSRLIRSTDGGATWNIALPAAPWEPLGMAPDVMRWSTILGAFVVLYDSDFYTSTDYGATWTLHAATETGVGVFDVVG